MTQILQALIPQRAQTSTGYAAMTQEPTVATGRVACAWSRAASFRAALVATVLLAVLISTLLGSPSPRYLNDPALARLLRGMAVVKGLMTLGAIAAIWWRTAWPASVRLTVAAITAVCAQVAATVWIARLVVLPWAAGLYHVGLAVLFVCAWREHRAEFN